MMTEKQIAAVTRNQQIFRLRGLWHNLSPLTEERYMVVRGIIDGQLMEMGAVPEMERQRQRRKLADEYFGRTPAEPELPFN